MTKEQMFSQMIVINVIRQSLFIFVVLPELFLTNPDEGKDPIRPD